MNICGCDLYVYLNAWEITKLYTVLICKIIEIKKIDEILLICFSRFYFVQKVDMFIEFYVNFGLYGSDKKNEANNSNIQLLLVMFVEKAEELFEDMFVDMTGSQLLADGAD